MIEYMKTWLALKTDRRAVTALEYGVIAGILAVVALRLVATTAVATALWYGLESQILKFKRYF